MSEGWGPEPCWGCGSKGDHPALGGHYWPCGTMKCASIRGEQCYEAELTELKAKVEKLERVAVAAKIFNARWKAYYPELTRQYLDADEYELNEAISFLEAKDAGGEK